jgi:hypothetical protein
MVKRWTIVGNNIGPLEAALLHRSGKYGNFLA